MVLSMFDNQTKSIYLKVESNMNAIAVVCISVLFTNCCIILRLLQKKAFALIFLAAIRK